MFFMWRLLDLGSLPPVQTQAVYEAVALERDKGNVPDTLILCYPESPLVCIGFHQEAAKEVDLEFCRLKGIPVVRRILGGGAVYLDGNQLFYQVIVHRSNPVVPGAVAEFFRFLLEAPVRTYRQLGVSAYFKPVNDIEVEGRKISGNGAGIVGEVNVLTGNIIFDFDYDMMVRVLKVPSEKFRDKFAKSLRDRVTTLLRELGRKPPLEKVKSLLVRNFEEVLGAEMVEGELTDRERRLTEEIEKKYLSDEWTYARDFSHPELAKKVKVAGSTFVAESAYKAPGGLIRVTLEFEEDKILDVLISGDFWMYPEVKLEKLEEKLKGVKLRREEVLNAVSSFYSEEGVEVPSVTPEDFTQAIMQAAHPTSGPA
nr:lipoate--protein ligase family protein [Candidatus Bathyarchaeota archaeon]